MASILIIDDEEDIRDVLKQIFEREGYDVRVAVDGDEGTRMYQQDGADVVIADVIMPNKDGIETIRCIRAHCADAKIIAISGGGNFHNAAYRTRGYYNVGLSGGGGIPRCRPNVH